MNRYSGLPARAPVTAPSWNKSWGWGSEFVPLPAVTDWFPGVVAPAYVGVYHVQPSHLACDCCYLEAHWDGLQWHCQVHSKGPFSVWMPHGVRRWRGMAHPPVDPSLA